ncbi:unnamed protein product [Mytilus edulis]|uniref:Uncharacterized protein n=1 Tax=Mytilus edulis TaxID=6550 RepID=A0A8S3TFK3_MYTED|nr:unnamed protein product [Mytilus edulis]
MLTLFLIIDLITKYLSTELYEYMCQHIVGTEDRVKQIRLLNALRDNLSICGDRICITSGSFGEGLEMRGSDLDMMFVQRNIEVYDVKPRLNPNISYLFMNTDYDVKPGFTQLTLEYSNNQTIFDKCVQFGDTLYLSSTLWKQRSMVHIGNSAIKALAYNLLGIAFQLLGDTEAARKALSQSIELLPQSSLNPAVQRLFAWINCYFFIHLADSQNTRSK